MLIIGLFFIEEGDSRSIIMIGHSLWNNIKSILLKWQGFKVMDIIKRGLSKFLMGKGVIMSKMKDNKDNSKMKMKQ
jgi:hypothetical protein